MKIAAIIVTFNRKDLLIKVLDVFENMLVKPNHLIIVNNASTDGTDFFLNDWSNEILDFNVEIHHLESNIGGSGGFNFGLNIAKNLDVDWVWLSDDDAFPETTIFQDFKKIESSISLDNVGAYCTSVINNGQIDLGHRRYLTGGWIKKEVKTEKSDYEAEYFKVNLFSYVGAIIKKDVLLDLGVTEKDYFIWYDDTEHSMRINKKYNIYCLPSLKVIHDELPSTLRVNWKSYYGIRNRLITYKKHYKLTYLYMVFKLILKIIFIQLRSGRGNKFSLLAIRALISSFKGEKGVNINYYPGADL